MTYWAARGCLRYGQPDAAGRLLERALDASAAQFERTGTIWEFNHPLCGEPREMARKHGGEQQGPCPDYLGHNPLIAMARLWQAER
jgi:putative isomerase